MTKLTRRKTPTGASALTWRLSQAICTSAAPTHIHTMNTPRHRRRQMTQVHATTESAMHAIPMLLMRSPSNENKMSDGWRGSASLRVEKENSWEVWDQSCQPFAPSHG